MEYGAIAIAALGLVTGLLVRLKGLLPIVGILFVGAVVFSIISGSTFLDAALTILVTQSILQGSYFLGATIKALISDSHGSPRAL